MNQTLRQMLPAAALAASPSPKMSERYVHISTEQVCNLMLKEGFTIANAKAIKGRGSITGKAAAAQPSAGESFGKHVIDFRHPDVPTIGDSVPRFVFVNSHDGSTRASVLAGVFRFVCSNGMVVGNTYASEKVRHFGQDAAGILARISELAKNTAPLFCEIESWQKKEMSLHQRREFATLASQLRFGDPYRFDAQALLTPRREEDDKGDLWTTFNVVQEACTKGGTVGLSPTGRISTSRPLTEVGADIKFNEQLWQLAGEFATF